MNDFSNILLTVDFDRTLTGPDSTIPKRNLEAIEYFMANGGSFTVNTGRSVPMSMQNIIGKVPVNAPLLLYNGSADYDTVTGEFTRFSPIELDADRLVEDLQLRFPELNVEIQAVDAHYLIRKHGGWEGYCENNHCRWGYGYPSKIPGPFIKAAIYGQFRENTVAAMYETTPWEAALFEEAIAYLENAYGEKVDLFRACARILDIHAQGCSKGNAARSLQRKLGKDILVCVGDAENDLAMLEQADYAFCPADGVVADRFPNVCKCDDGAIADVIYKKIPEILEFQP
jgi:HAD superfamily hydrolase (TIGR01484 family)